MSPLDKLICLGKNYLEHAKELGDAVPEKPVLFLKPPSVLRAVERNDESIRLSIPEGRGELHHECEVVVRLRQGGQKLSVVEALNAFDAVTLGLDMTLREAQATLKKQGHPWEIGKVFADAAVRGPWLPASALAELADEAFTLAINGRVRQSARIGELRLSIAESIAYASEYFPLCAGDLVYTGTPAGVGPVVSGDRGELRWGRHLGYRVEWI